MPRSFWSLFAVTVVSGVLSACATSPQYSADPMVAESKPDTKSTDSAAAAQKSAEDQAIDSAMGDATEDLSKPKRSIVIKTEDETIVVSGVTDTMSSDGEVQQQPTVVIEHTGDAQFLKKRIVHFDFDSSDIKDDDRQIIEAHARLLAENSDILMVLQGHADERGSREYNIALGERRAGGVGQLMELLGVSDHQLRVVSYGEERPVALGHDESSWRVNRRANLTYR